MSVYYTNKHLYLLSVFSNLYYPDLMLHLHRQALWYPVSQHLYLGFTMGGHAGCYVVAYLHTFKG